MKSSNKILLPILFTILNIATLNTGYTQPSVNEFLDQIETEIRLKKNNLVEGRVITFNTQDFESCNESRIQLNLDEKVCVYNKETPYVSIIVARELKDKEHFDKKIQYSKLNDKEKIALSSLATYTIGGLATFGAIYALPESVSKWDKSRGLLDMTKRYSDRIKQGPRVDDDDWAINYIGHPLSGAFYYTMVRHQGYSALESAAFSVCMSTFFWEYGLEAFAEIPSVQDLILTPLIGSIIGEVFYAWEIAIQNNGGKLLGSHKLGMTASVLMNPVGALERQINKVAKYKLIEDTELSINIDPAIYLKQSKQANPLLNKSKPLRVELRFVF